MESKNKVGKRKSRCTQAKKEIEETAKNVVVEEPEEYEDGAAVDKYLYNTANQFLYEDISDDMLKRKRKATVWPNGEIPYEIDEDLDAETKKTVKQAIREWNSIVGDNCEWIQADGEPYAVVFKKSTNKGLEASEIGFKNQENWIKLDPRFRKGGLFIGDILHEMGHIAGLRHEFARPDAHEHVNKAR